jgi:hypothetical protein
MIRKMTLFITLTASFGFFALARPAGTEAQLNQDAKPTPSITGVTLPDSGCGIEVTCAEVKWNVSAPPKNQQSMSFEVSGKLIIEPNTSCNTNVVTLDHAARSAKVGVFQGGSCAGTVKRADMTVKLFIRNASGQKVLTSTAFKSQTF